MEHEGSTPSRIVSRDTRAPLLWDGQAPSPVVPVLPGEVTCRVELHGGPLDGWEGVMDWDGMTIPETALYPAHEPRADIYQHVYYMSRIEFAAFSDGTLDSVAVTYEYVLYTEGDDVLNTIRHLRPRP